MANKPKPYVNRTLVPSSCHITQEQQNKMRDMLLSGQFPNKAMIARACMVSRNTVDRYVKNNPDVEQAWHDAIAAQIDKVEQSHFELAQSGRNEIAKEKAQENILRHYKREIYGDDIPLSSSQSAVKRIIIAPVMPVIQVDAEGIPIEQPKKVESQSPLEV